MDSRGRQSDVRYLLHSLLSPKQLWCKNLNTIHHKQFEWTTQRELSYGEVGCSADPGKRAWEKVCPPVVHLLAGVCSKAVCEFIATRTKQPHK